MTLAKRLEVTDRRTGLLIVTTSALPGLTLAHSKKLALEVALVEAARSFDWDDLELDGPPSLSELEVREVGATVLCNGEAA